MRPADLWAPGVVFDPVTAALFWEAARDSWLMVTFVVAKQTMYVYTGGQLWGTGSLEASIPRMKRMNNYVGAGQGAPFRAKTGGMSLAVADFRLFDRSLMQREVEALFTGEHAACCVAAAIMSPFAVGDIDTNLW